MAEYKALVRWAHTHGNFAKGTFSREHAWTFDGGVTIPASSSPSVVPVPWSNDACVNPEEAFVAAIASCHMLSFLNVARRAGFHVMSYSDEAVGRMAKNDRGGMWVSVVVLTPRPVYLGSGTPTAAEEAHLHEVAHAGCFIANSVKTDIVVSSK
jgi:organic hydroperoxide reductase OsmC/OhrA